MKKRLVFDVSTQLMFVGYIKGDQLVDYSIRVALRDHAKYLVDRIDQLLKRNKLTLEGLDELIVGHGPGSYTGIRIAVTVAKMLGYTKKIPVKTISSLMMMTSGYERKVAPAIDARRGSVFTGIYDKGTVLLSDRHMLLKDLYELPEYQGAELIFIDDRNYEISAKRIVEHAVLVKDIHALVPHYLRKTEAEMNHDQTR